MIKVSDAWKNAHEQMLLPESFVEISMDVTDTKVSGTVSSTNVASFANSSVILNANKKVDREPYVTLEHNRWMLGCSTQIASDTSALKTNTRYVSANGSTDKVTINLTSTGGSIPGVTITWSSEYNEYATAFQVTAKNGSTVLGSVTVTDNDSDVSTVDMPVSGYNTLEITISEWSVPDHRHRIDSVKFGQMLVFDKSQIISYTHEMSGDPLGTELSRNVIEFEVDNHDGRWNILNPTGLGKYLYARQRLIVHYGLQLDGGIEWIQAGVFYLSEWKAPANGMTATFVARDAIEFMLNATYSRTHLEGKVDGATAIHAAKENVFTIMIEEDSSGSTAEVNTEGAIGTLSSGTKVLIYEKSALYYNENTDDPDHCFKMYRVGQGWVNDTFITVTSDTELDTDITAAISSCLPSDIPVVYYQSFAPGTRPFAIEKIAVAEFVQQCMATTASTICQSADGTLHVGGEIMGVYGAYRIPLRLSYSHPEVELTKPLKEIHRVCHYHHTDKTRIDVHKVGNTGEVIVLDSPYFSDKNLLDTLPDAYRYRWSGGKLVSGEFRADPRLELFDAVEVETKYGVLEMVELTNIKYTYNGSFRCTYNGRVLVEEMEEIMEEE